ncbi:MAG TPA: hypothetical protein VG963_18935, partial [Polyangiaceae bacterium]|nr:hypothetical protein [Polyangiaceae bacterium]
ATYACGAGSCGECQGFDGAAGFPNTTDSCVSQSSLTLDDAKFSSLGGNGSVWLCGASSIYGIMSQHLALVAGPSQPARISFAAPVISLSFGFAARSFAASQGLALEVAGDDHVIGSIMQDASKVGSWSHHFDAPIAVLSLRSLGQNNQEIALDDLVFEPAMCK